jgi:hypothetical protein
MKAFKGFAVAPAICSVVSACLPQGSIFIPESIEFKSLACSVWIRNSQFSRHSYSQSEKKYFSSSPDARICNPEVLIRIREPVNYGSGSGSCLYILWLSIKVFCKISCKSIAMIKY